MLARDIEGFYNKYDQEVKDYLDENKFKYETIVQDDTCTYYFKTLLEANYKSECDNYKLNC